MPTEVRDSFEQYSGLKWKIEQFVRVLLNRSIDSETISSHGNGGPSKENAINRLRVYKPFCYFYCKDDRALTTPRCCSTFASSSKCDLRPIYGWNNASIQTTLM